MPKSKINPKATVSFALVSQMMGASLLSMPYIFSQLGVVLTIVAFIIVYVVMVLLLSSFTEVIHYTQSLSYREATKKICGKHTCQLLNICLIISYYGFCTGYILISSRNVFYFIKNVSNSFTLDIIYIKLIISFIIILPLTLVRKMTILSKISSISSFIILITVLSITTLFFMKLPNKTVCGNSTYNISIIPQKSPLQITLTLLMYIPSIQSNFGSYNAIPSLLNSIQGPAIFRKQTVKIATLISCSFGAVFYLLTGFLGAIMFGADVQNNIFLNLGECNFLWFNILSLCYALVVIISFPLVIFPIKETLLQQYNRTMNDTKGYIWSILIDFLFVILSFGLAAIYEDIVVIFAIFASLSGFVYVFCLPMIFLLKLPQIRQDNAFLDQDEGDQTIDPLIVPILAQLMSVERARAITVKLFGNDNTAAGAIVSPKLLKLLRTQTITVSASVDGPVYQRSVMSFEQSKIYAQSRSFCPVRVNNFRQLQDSLEVSQDGEGSGALDVPEVQQVAVVSAITKGRKIGVFIGIGLSSVVCCVGAFMNVKSMIESFIK